MFNHIIHPITKNKISLFSKDGKSLLKHYVRLVQIGGTHPESIDTCQKCNKFYNRISYSDTSLEAYNFCINCAEKLLHELKRHDKQTDTYKEFAEALKEVINKIEKVKKSAAHKGVNLAKIREKGMEIRKKLHRGSTARSVPRSVPRSTVSPFTTSMSAECRHALQIANDMLNKLYDKERFSISFNDLYKLIMSTDTRDSIVYINPYYEQEYNTLLSELFSYKNELEMQCSSPYRLRLINILKFFINTSNTDGGTAKGTELPIAPSTELPPIASVTPQRQRVAVAIPSGL